MLAKQLNLVRTIILISIGILLLGGDVELSRIFIMSLTISSSVLIFSKKHFKSLIAVVFITLFLGLILVIYNKGYINSTYSQANVLTLYILYSIINLLSWYNSYTIAKLEADVDIMAYKLDRYLEKESVSSTLTMSEFKNQKRFILQGASQRNESVVFMQIRLNSLESKIFYTSLVSKMDSVLKSALRRDYDIFTLADNNMFHVILQNSSLKHAEAVKEDIISKFYTSVSVDRNLISIEYYEILERRKKEVVL